MLLFISRPRRPKRARSHRNTGSSQQANMDISSSSFCVEGHVRLLRGPDAMEQNSHPRWRPSCDGE